MNQLRSKPEAVQWLANHGLGVSGNKKQLNDRIRLYERYPGLVRKLRQRFKYNRKFPCSLDENTIPPLTAPWKADDNILPKVTPFMFSKYASNKREGSLGQQAKAVQMLQSRKIVNVKTLREVSKTYVRGLIKPSFGNDSRPAIVLFENSIPVKAYCRCTIGSSGICCHVLAILLFLQHFTETGEKLLELTCTQQLQTWHKRARKGSIPMLPLAQIKVKSAKLRKGSKGIQIAAADPNKSYFKRDVPKIIKEIEKRLAHAKPINEHFYSVLSKSKIGQTSAFGEHICFKFEMQKNTNVVNENSNVNKVKKTVFDGTSVEGHEHSVPIESILDQDMMDILIVEPIYMYEDSDSLKLSEEIQKQLRENKHIIEIDLSFLEAPKPFGENYIDVCQKSVNWHSARKNKITGSRIPSLLGLYGKNKFENYWNIVQHDVDEKDLSHLENIKRGLYYEAVALQHFVKISKSTVQTCGFFLHPTNKNFGASPDALCASGMLLEIKTRASNSDGPLTSLKDFPNYFMQCQLQMECTNSHSCILMSYHPETEQGIFFLITRDNVLMEIVIDVCNRILKNEVLFEWSHVESTKLAKLGDALMHKPFTFENLKPLRSYVKCCCKNIPKVRFIDEMNIIN